MTVLTIYNNRPVCIHPGRPPRLSDEQIGEIDQALRQTPKQAGLTVNL
ncbi:MAG: hypothetical protein ACXW4G_11085 [Candidatus Deferrimicrobiaceae bacterium]